MSEPLCCISLGVCHRRRVRLCLFLGTGDCASSPTLRVSQCDPFPKGDDAPLSMFLSPLGVDRQASRDTALHLRCHCCTDGHAVVLSGTRSSVANCVRGAHREDVTARVGQRTFVLCPPYSPTWVGMSRTPHLCAVPTILFTSTCGVEYDQTSDQIPHTPTITSQVHVTKT